MKNINAEIKGEVDKLRTRLTEISIKVDSVGEALHHLKDNSYQYDVKTFGLTGEGMSADPFKSIGEDVQGNHKDIAHRVPSRKQNGRPRLIICKFVGQVVKDNVSIMKL